MKLFQSNLIAHQMLSLVKANENIRLISTYRVLGAVFQRPKVKQEYQVPKWKRFIRTPWPYPLGNKTTRPFFHAYRRSIRYRFKRPVRKEGTFEGQIKGAACKAVDEDRFEIRPKNIRLQHRNPVIKHGPDRKFPGRPFSTYSIAYTYNPNALSFNKNFNQDKHERTYFDQARFAKFINSIYVFITQTIKLILQKTKKYISLALAAAVLAAPVKENLQISNAEVDAYVDSAIQNANAPAEKKTDDAEKKEETLAYSAFRRHIAKCEDESNGQWHALIDKNEWSLWRRSAAEVNQVEYKINGRYDDVSALDLLDSQVDVEYRRNWDGLTRELEVLRDEDETDHTQVIRWVLNYPYPLKPREYVFMRRAEIDHDRKVAIVVNKSCPNVTRETCFEADANEKDTGSNPTKPTSASKNLVRVNNYASVMIIKPDDEFDKKGCKFTITYIDDNGSSIPVAVNDWIVKRGLPEFSFTVRNSILNRDETRPYVFPRMPESLRNVRDVEAAGTENDNSRHNILFTRTMDVLLNRLSWLKNFYDTYNCSMEERVWAATKAMGEDEFLVRSLVL